MSASPVTVRREPLILPTYEPQPPDKNPMFLEKRVYQGSSGKVYPLPFYNRISETKTPRPWDAVHIENEYLLVTVLPEIGGRIHIGRDKTNGYDFFYNQGVIKPALVGLAGPWASGGVEFNWPQHHRPATFMPVDVEIESHPDGSKTVWLSDHDPLTRMKGMHGVCLHPGKAIIELKMRAYNRTPFVQTFLWWANVATHVHEGYQSFFPPDVRFVADHAKRAVSAYPLCNDKYYGVDYGKRLSEGVPHQEAPTLFLPPHIAPESTDPAIPNYAPNDLSWYANIPVPTSYMAIGSTQDFSGGYDYKKAAGLIQISNHHISPGKKQWTWGNHAFGYAWDRNLTDSAGPYIELMLGVYTDNQPDFSFLQPGETKTWSVFWYPIQQIGPAQQANARAALVLRRSGEGVQLGVAVTEALSQARIEVRSGERVVANWIRDLSPDRPFIATEPLGEIDGLELRLSDSAGQELLRYQHTVAAPGAAPAPATEPPSPEAVTSADELYTIGLHLAQYRHATRSPTLYWQEALRRDPLDARCNTAMGNWHLARGEFSAAEQSYRRAITRITSRNPDPYDGEPYYQLGLTLRYLGRDAEAYDAFYKAVWNQSWQAAGYHALAEIDCARGDWTRGLDHLDRALRVNQDNLRARDLKAVVLRRLSRETEADELLRATLRLDPLDWWARYLLGESLTCSSHTRVDVALDCARAGLHADAEALLNGTRPEPYSGSGPLVAYHLAIAQEKRGDLSGAAQARLAAASASLDYCFPARLEDELALLGALRHEPGDARANYLLGNLRYDKRRYTEAITDWERAVAKDPAHAIAWRNLGIAYFNVQHDGVKARQAYERAILAAPQDSRLLYERDQLWKRLGVSPAERLEALEARLDLVHQRDDACIELCALYNQLGWPARAVNLIIARRFQPWEGGEGQALGQFVRTMILLAREALANGRPQQALDRLSAALRPPENLGESRHALANAADVWFWLGEAYSQRGDTREARRCWAEAAAARGDFQEMSVRAFSEMTLFSARALRRLGQEAEAQTLCEALLVYAVQLRNTRASIDYFATSLPTMLLFNDDLQFRQETTALFLEAQAHFGLGRFAEAAARLRQTLERDPNHVGASDLAREPELHRHVLGQG